VLLPEAAVPSMAMVEGVVKVFLVLCHRLASVQVISLETPLQELEGILGNLGEF
jgi:hypothetical protein